MGRVHQAIRWFGQAQGDTVLYLDPVWRNRYEVPDYEHRWAEEHTRSLIHYQISKTPLSCQITQSHRSSPDLSRQADLRAIHKAPFPFPHSTPPHPTHPLTGVSNSLPVGYVQRIVIWISHRLNDGCILGTSRLDYVAYLRDKPEERGHGSDKVGNSGHGLPSVVLSGSQAFFQAVIRNMRWTTARPLLRGYSTSFPALWRPGMKRRKITPSSALVKWETTTKANGEQGLLV